MKNNRLWAAFLLAGLLLCTPGSVPPAAAQEAAENEVFDEFESEFETRSVSIADPLAPWNRVMFQVNDKLYFYVLKPVASAYQGIVHEWFRRGVRNFFHNLTTPGRMVASLLQGKSERAGNELGAFMLNTTAGVLGFGNPAAVDHRLQVPEEDLGQSLATWSMGHGVYLYWPLFGPLSLRDTVGALGDRFLDPTTYIDPSSTATAVSAVKNVNAASFRLGQYEALKESAVAPYEAMRDAYVQYRAKQVEE